MGAAQDMRYTSKQGTKLTADASADAAGIARAEIKIDFTVDGAFVFHASGIRAQRLQNLSEIGRQVVAAYEQGSWEKSWILVEALYAADCATIVVSQDSSAGLTLAAKIDTPVPELSQKPTWESLQAAANSCRSWASVTCTRCSRVFG